MLKALKRRGAIFAKSAKLERFDGYSESWLRKSLDVKKIGQIIKWIHEDEQEATKARSRTKSKSRFA